MTTLSQLFTNPGDFLPESGFEDLDMTKGGHFGFAPDHTSWASAKAYARQNLIIMLLEAPKFMSLMNNSSQWYGALRAFVETQPSSVTGFEAGLTATVVDHAAGASGEIQQDFTKVTRERSTPVFNFESDRANNIIQKMIATWMTYGMSDPSTGIPLAITLPDYKLQTRAQKHWLADWYSMTFIAMEPNATMTQVVNSWLVTNSWPTGTGPISGKRDKANPLEVPQLSFEFTAYSEFNEGVNRFAETLLSKIIFKGANPNVQTPFITSVGADVAGVDEVGYGASVEHAGGSTVD